MQLRKAGEEIGQLQQAAAAGSAQSVEQEQQKTVALAQEAEAALQALTASAAKHRQALDEERARSAALTDELATAKRENEMQTAQLRKASEEIGQLKQASERVMADLRQSLQQERDRAEVMAREIESARRTTVARVTPEPAANSSISNADRVIEVAATAQPPAAEAHGSPEATKLIARARTLLGQGNIGAARIVLERAAETGSARASFTLAETYDPVILSTWGTYGTRGDAIKARELYAKAHAAGILDAKDRLERLNQ
jgi:DNA repair exonuclease SbcCD ATPase subunit